MRTTIKNMREIHLTNSNKVALVSEEDYDKIREYSWREHIPKNKKTTYAVTGHPSSCNRWFMHEMVIGVASGRNVTHHLNEDGLDNRRENLVTVTSATNTAASTLKKTSISGYRGVYLDRRRGKWTASISHNGRQKHLGNFSSAEDAAKVYDKAATSQFGQFARTNNVV